MDTELNFYPMFKYSQLVTMGNVYYGGSATAFQKTRYEQIRIGLLKELQSLDPTAKDAGIAAYIHAAITATIEHNNRHEKIMTERMHANAQTAHNQLRNWK